MKLKYLPLLAGLALALSATAQTPAPQPGGFAGQVVETMNAGGYTYVLVDTGAKKLWAAAPQFEVRTGATVTVGEGMPMSGYHSKTLNRDFDVVYFTGSATVAGKSPTAKLPPGHPALAAATGGELPKDHPPLTGTAAPNIKVDLTGIKKASGGKTVQEIYAGKAKLAGKTVAVRGKVVKYNPDIMGKNWLHLQDGTGSAGTDDLMVTTTAAGVKVGNTVLVTGVVSQNKDFGAGYKYAVILDGAKVVVE